MLLLYNDKNENNWIYYTFIRFSVIQQTYNTIRVSDTYRLRQYNVDYRRNYVKDSWL
jgi:hypothetical protein